MHAFIIVGRKSIIDNRNENVPGGGIFIANLEDSVSSEIFFDLAIIGFGREIEGVRLNAKNGEITEFWAYRNEGFLRVLVNTDKASKKKRWIKNRNEYESNKVCQELAVWRNACKGGTAHLYSKRYLCHEDVIFEAY